MKVTIFGCGYVGLVTAACFADVGHNVVCIDTNAERVAMLLQGQSPIYEPGLAELLQQNLTSKRIDFTTNAKAAIEHGQYIFIAVGTPQSDDGAPNLSYVNAVADSIGKYMTTPKIVINKSTVPVGTADAVVARIQAKLAANVKFSMASNPEFLKEGAAIDDFTKPDRIIVGASDAATIDAMRELYAPFNRSSDRFVAMDIRSAELTKYAANAMLATKISLMNELCNLAENLGADIEHVRKGIGSDPRIGYDFIYPGCGYGGSCFPKDVRALVATGEQTACATEILRAVDTVNTKQKTRLFSKIQKHFNNRLQGKTIALWGLAFKPNTDDIREAASCVLIEALWQAGVRVQAYDPCAMDSIRNTYGERDDLRLASSPYEITEGADALVIVTEWAEFRSPDFTKLKAQLKHPVIFDGRNMYDPKQLDKLGFTYYAMGRGASIEIK